MPRKYIPKKTEPPEQFVPGFMQTLDGRTLTARALKERYAAIVNDLGGEERLSTIQLSLVERYLWLESYLSKLEHEMAHAEDTHTITTLGGKWAQGVNALSGLASKLGLNKSPKAKTIPSFALYADDDQDDSQEKSS